MEGDGDHAAGARGAQQEGVGVRARVRAAEKALERGTTKQDISPL